MKMEGEDEDEDAKEYGLDVLSGPAYMERSRSQNSAGRKRRDKSLLKYFLSCKGRQLALAIWCGTRPTSQKRRRSRDSI